MEDDFELFEKILKENGLIVDDRVSQVVCTHSVMVEGSCVDCHQHFEDASNFAPVRVRRRCGPSLFPDLINRGFSDTVIDDAQRYFRETQLDCSTFRGKMRSAVIAASVYHALLKNGSHASFVTIARLFGVEKRVASRGFQRVKMSVSETRNQFETPHGVASWILEIFFENTLRREQIAEAVKERFGRVRLSPSSMRASVAAAIYLMIFQDVDVTIAQVAERADASPKKVAALAHAFKKIKNNGETI